MDFYYFGSLEGNKMMHSHNIKNVDWDDHLDNWAKELLMKYSVDLKCQKIKIGEKRRKIRWTI